jgi:hypothetical protein
MKKANMTIGLMLGNEQTRLINIVFRSHGKG